MQLTQAPCRFCCFPTGGAQHHSFQEDQKQNSSVSHTFISQLDILANAERAQRTV